MDIYQLEHVTWGSGQYSDFGLPLTIGHYKSMEAAERGRAAHIASIMAIVPADEADCVTTEDYRIYTLHVED